MPRWHSTVSRGCRDPRRLEGPVQDAVVAEIKRGDSRDWILRRMSDVEFRGSAVKLPDTDSQYE